MTSNLRAYAILNRFIVYSIQFQESQLTIVNRNKRIGDQTSPHLYLDRKSVWNRPAELYSLYRRYTYDYQLRNNQQCVVKIDRFGKPHSSSFLSFLNNLHRDNPSEWLFMDTELKSSLATNKRDLYT